LKKEELEAAKRTILERWGRIDILVNAAGGNVPAATLSTEQTIFDLTEPAFREVCAAPFRSSIIFPWRLNSIRCSI
jgi:NAD(P)-dependent dehydrogenase (short-subunit alcohol dehydrogenase family)